MIAIWSSCPAKPDSPFTKTFNEHCARCAVLVIYTEGHYKRPNNTTLSKIKTIYQKSEFGNN